MDKLLEMAFADPKRWEKAIEHGLDKGVDRKWLEALAKESTRIAIYQSIKDGKYKIAPPHTALIPKDKPGEFRTVYINEPPDRVVLSLLNDLLFELTPEMVHPICTSYKRGVSCGKVVQKISKRMTDAKTDGVIGWKNDLSKYFDSVEIQYIDEAFDRVEDKFGKSKLINVVRAYYHQDWYFDTDNKLQNAYQSLKQGCAVAAWLADVILYPLDAEMDRIAKENNAVAYRYSDDQIFLGNGHEEALEKQHKMLAKMGLKLNPKKIEMIDRNHWVKFLGYSIKGRSISLSSSGIKKFQAAIEDACNTDNYAKAFASVNRALYKGYDGYSWATRVLRVINVDHDITMLNGYVMDSLRAVKTKHRNIGGLGFVKGQKDGCIARGKGKNVKTNRTKIPKLDGYITIKCMQKDLLTSRALFDEIVRTLM